MTSADAPPTIQVVACTEACHAVRDRFDAMTATIAALSTLVATHAMTISVQGTEIADLKNDKAERQRESRAFATKIVIGQLTAGGVAAALAKFVL